MYGLVKSNKRMRNKKKMRNSNFEEKNFKLKILLIKLIIHYKFPLISLMAIRVKIEF